MRCRRPCRRATPAYDISSRFSSTVRLGKTLRPSGTVVRPTRARSSGFAPRDVHAGKVDVARRLLHLAGDDLEQGGLARAVRAEQCNHGATRHGEVDPAQNLDPAVGGVQVDDLQNRDAHSATSSAAGSVAVSSSTSSAVSSL